MDDGINLDQSCTKFVWCLAMIALTGISIAILYTVNILYVLVFIAELRFLLDKMFLNYFKI
jgi:hypothetical protein